MLQALARARQDQSSLAGEKAVLERETQQHLLWSGQALVASSITCMEDAVHQIRTVFLMPSKELKCAPLSMLSTMRRPAGGLCLLRTDGSTGGSL